MKWVLIQRIHINTDRIQSFHWIEGRLYVRFAGEDSVTFRDPDREAYIRLCRCLGVRPMEGEHDGKN